ncbi:MAG: V-type ATP synthase subunit D [Deltaproteobacteria bacterium]|nr:V-type ATP synthase subunit D [Deltaproteobacteria bacterium]
MAKKIAIARPTKIELARLKRRLKLARRIQKIMKDRLSILIMEFLQTVRDCAAVKARLLDRFAEAYRYLSLASGFHGTAVLEKELLRPQTVPILKAGTKNVGGVRIPFFEMEQEKGSATLFETADSSSYVDRSREQAIRCLETLAELAEMERALEFLGMEINKIKRISNALEYMIVPGLYETIRFLTMKFEERDREEVSRLKFVKLLIEKREAHAV